MVSPAPDPAPAVRVELDATHGYELTLLAPHGIAMHLFEPNHDAVAQLTPLQIVELRAELATALLALGHGNPAASGIISPAGHALVEHLRQIFAALVELDKHRPGEVDAVCGVLVGHLRSWRPFVLRGAVQP